MIVAALASTILAVWIANQDLPRVTHSEAMAMALAIDQADDLAKLEQLVHFEGLPPVPGEPPQQPGDSSKRLAAYIQHWKGKSAYAFVESRTDDRGGKSLMFRCASGDDLFDYQELRLERCLGQVKVTDLWSLTEGGWLREIVTEQAKLPAANQVADATEPGMATTGAEQVPPPARARFVDRAALAQFRAAQPKSLAPELAILMFPIRLEASQQEVLIAINRIRARVGDDGFLQQVRARLLR